MGKYVYHTHSTYPSRCVVQHTTNSHLACTREKRFAFWLPAVSKRKPPNISSHMHLYKHRVFGLFKTDPGPIHSSNEPTTKGLSQGFKIGFEQLNMCKRQDQRRLCFQLVLGVPPNGGPPVGGARRAERNCSEKHPPETKRKLFM